MPQDIIVPGATAADYHRASEVMNLWSFGIATVKRSGDEVVADIIDRCAAMTWLEAMCACRAEARKRAS